MSEKTDNKIPNVPNLRFNKNEIWHLEQLIKFAKKITLKNKNNSIDNIICNSAQNGLIQQKDFFDRTIVNNDNTENYYVIEQGDFVYNPRKSTTAPFGPVNIYEYKSVGIVSPLYLCFKVDGINKEFLNYYFKSSAWYRYIYENGDSGARHDRVSIKDKIFLEQPIIIPTLNEQEKIATFLSKIDDRIETQSKIIRDLEILIKGIRYIIFSKLTNSYKNTKLQKLGSFLTEYSKKNTNNNLQSASIGKYGIRMRDEIYSKDLTSDYSKNKVIFKDTLSIGMGSSQIDIGILSEDEKYCISPAYTTYKIDNINSKYLNEYLIYLNPLLSKRYMIIGARQGKSVNKSELLEHELSIHSMQEQHEIVKIFSSLFAKLQKEKDILSLYKKQKVYLLQNMFI